MTVVVVDGMGGGVGAQVVERLRKTAKNGLTIIALGTNALATQRMLDSGADRGASGENAIKVSIGMGDVIAGPIGIVMPNSMMGEISPAIAEAVMGSRGRKVLIPLAQNHASIAGLAQKALADLIEDAIALTLAE